MCNESACRSDAFDILKCCAMYLVIVGHCIQYLFGGYYSNSLWLAIYTFHVPLFMIISGYFFRTVRFTSFPECGIYVKSRAVSFLQPCLAISVILVLCLLILGAILGKDLITFDKLYSIFVLDQWFLKSLLVDTIIVAFICCWESIWIRILFSVIVAVILLRSGIHDIWSVKETLIYFVLGIGLRAISCRIRLNNVVFFFFVLACFIILLLGYKVDYSAQFTSLSLEANALYAYCYRTIFAFVISVMLISLLLILIKNNVHKRGRVRTLFG